MKIRSVVSQTLLFSASALFLAFHFLPMSGRSRGWRIWQDLWDMSLVEWGHLRYKDLVMISCFVSFSLLILISPFLRKVWERSRWARWGCSIFSGLTGSVFVGTYWISVSSRSDSEPANAALLCLLWAPVLNFIGLCLAPPMREISPEAGD